MASKNDIIEEHESQISAEIGEYLSSQYGVLVKILQGLNAKDLKNASKVCRAWESAAKKILSAETKLKWLFYRRDRGWNVAPQLATWTAMCEHLYFDPDICLCFITKRCFKEKLKCNLDVPCPVSSDTPCQGTHLFREYLKSFLEPSCRLLVFPVSGVVSTDQDLSRTWEVDYYQSKEKGSSAMSTIFFPKMKGVTVVTFKLAREEVMTLSQARNKNVDIVKLLGLPENEVVQAVLLFCSGSMNQRCTSVVIAKLQERQKHRIAAGGAIVDESECFEGIVFCGPNVCAASIILSENVCEKEQVQEQLLKLKDCSLPMENSIAFMFACLARGCAWYENEPNVESQIINKTFPKTPVVGFFGCGEMGVQCLPDFNDEMRRGSRHFWKYWEQVCKVEKTSDADAAGTVDGEPPKKIQHRSCIDINYSYSTSIVLLSFNTVS